MALGSWIKAAATSFYATTILTAPFSISAPSGASVIQGGGREGEEREGEVGRK